MVARIAVQIYEIQTPAEAEQMLAIGVDRIGSVILSETDWRDAELRRALAFARSRGAQTSLIPLFHSVEATARVTDYYQPDILHFCEAVRDIGDGRDLARKQDIVKRRFPEIQIMRSIPIARRAGSDFETLLSMARVLEPVSDYFLTDTVLNGAAAAQPVQGFVGITGKTCDWNAARALVEASRIPVVLAGGISPENVFDGILHVRPAGVDSCTCTNAVDESGRPIRFRKNLEKVKQLVRAVRSAEAALERSL